MLKFGIYEPVSKVIDPMGSIIINTNSTGSPNFEWIYKAEVGAYGLPYSEITNILPYSDSVSYKIKLLDQIPKFAGTETTTSTSTTTTSVESTSTTTTTTGIAVSSTNNLASSSCYSTNSGVYESGCYNGPFRIGSKLYYIDFRVLYLVNLGDQPIYSPVFSVDTKKCTTDYGIFIGAPVILPNSSTNYVAGIDGPTPMFKQFPVYSNELNLFKDTILYKFTVLNNEGQTELLPITKDNLVKLVTQVGNIVDQNSGFLGYGQTSVVAEAAFNNNIILNAPNTSQDTVVLQNAVQANGFYPFVIFRYISATAPTAPVEISFTVAPTIA